MLRRIASFTCGSGVSTVAAVAGLRDQYRSASASAPSYPRAISRSRFGSYAGSIDTRMSVCAPTTGGSWTWML
jgi:hypothetical protein